MPGGIRGVLVFGSVEGERDGSPGACCFFFLDVYYLIRSSGIDLLDYALLGSRHHHWCFNDNKSSLDRFLIRLERGIYPFYVSRCSIRCMAFILMFVLGKKAGKLKALA